MSEPVWGQSLYTMPGLPTRLCFVDIDAINIYFDAETQQIDGLIVLIIVAIILDDDIIVKNILILWVLLKCICTQGANARMLYVHGQSLPTRRISNFV